MISEERTAKTMRIDVRPRPPPDDARGDVSPSSAVPAAVVDVRQAAGEEPSGYRKLLQSIYDAVIIADLSGRVVDFNPRATEFFRCTEVDLERARVDGLISGGDERLLEQIRRSLITHRYALIEAFCLRKDRTMFPAEIAVNRIGLSAQGQLCFFIRDISVRKRAEQALEDAIARLEEHDRAKSQFVSNVSHELRTPLTAMIYAVSNLSRGIAGPVTERMREYFAILDADCKRLLRTVNDILDLRKLDTKSLALVRTKVPLVRLAHRSVDSLRALAGRKHLRVSVSDAGHARFAHCDAHKIERVLLNLINNAIKFTPDGGSIEVRVSSDPLSPAMIRLDVVDNGIGIPREALPRVTERYYTVGDQPTGSGLGLAISKEIVELHGGRIEVSSPPEGRDRGTCVAIRLPVSEAPRVYVAHTDPAAQEQIARDLEGSGCLVLARTAGEHPFAEVERLRPDVVISDLNLPGMEGTELLFRMKASRSLARTPVIVVTTAQVSGAQGEVLRNFSIPALTIPWKGEELVNAVEDACLG